MTLTITHTHQDGTLIEGTSRGDGTAVILKALGWRWSRGLGTWYVQRSRDAAARHDLIDATRHRLEQSGLDVDVQVDDGRRDAVDVEASRLARAGDRADAMQMTADRADARAAAARSRSESADARLPDNGQPILVGHHSEAGHRRALARSDAATRVAIDAATAAREATRRAAVAARAVDRRYDAITVANRIDRLAAELRRARRQLDRYDRDSAPAKLRELVDQLAQDLAMWEQVRAKQIAAGVATDYGRHNVAAGDAVRVRGRWHRVVRANTKTVTVPSGLGSWTDTTPWHEVTDHRPADSQEQS